MLSFARFLLGVGGTALAVAASHAAGATTYTYQRISVPESYGTWVTALSDDGTVIGYYWDINYRTRGFSMKNGVYTNIDGLGLPATYPRAINNKGDVVGYFTEASLTQGFLLHNGKLRVLYFSKAAGTELVAINNSGVLAGNRFDTAGRPHPFRYEDGVFTRIPVDAPGTETLGVDAKGAVVGDMKRSGMTTGYIFKTSRAVPLKIPGAVTSGVNAISPDGRIAGFYATAGSLVTHGYTRAAHVVSTVDYPGATTTNLLAINNAGIVTGYGADANFQVLTAFSYEAGVFSPIVPPAATGAVVTVAVNASGQILGSDVEGSTESAFLATPIK